jgi:AraC-like DNA-binding protein
MRRADPIIDEVLAGVFNALGEHAEVAARASDGLVTALMAHLGVRYGGLRRAPSRFTGGLAPWQLRRAQAALADLARRPSLADLARLCDLSPGYFSRAFKASTGMTTTRWLNEHRVSRAAEMARDSGAPLAEIAIRCGFADQSHLTRAFSKLKGQSPAAWRRANRQT